ncbi:hypothetical protein G647_08654 [Cladophialophora carrionii CBS 160.54]|uniref:Uncharacterized protein n=1 Tax=Cladophialophora carrionii CBS 160.54 TaxID=1279043 RepID=V9D0Y6_9EURO|nr:uncharacterized protein G647_08654 [Cladophialophora carrionii CBS 160.54]ETI19642.1 hypothetical protein G647_08654 [Cladophialophora carrionii CBS 160.54]
MYRKRNGSLGFSFTRFANAAVPNFFADPTPSYHVDLTGYRRDMCYMHQIASADPYSLDERSFYVAGVVDSESVSKRVHAKLKKHEILREDGSVDTFKIGPRFPHQLALLNLNRQKDLVGMLFWWEEECQRLRKLQAEEKELDSLIEEAEGKVAAMATGTEDDSPERSSADLKGTVDQLKFARERVRMKRRQRPSQRDPDVEADKDDILGAFHGRSKSLPNPIVGAGVGDGIGGVSGTNGEVNPAQGQQLQQQQQQQHQQQDLGRPPQYFASS